MIKGIPPECQEENLQSVIEYLIEQARNSEKLKLERKKLFSIFYLEKVRL